MSDIEGEIHSLCVEFSIPGHHDDDVSPLIKEHSLYMT